MSRDKVKGLQLKLKEEGAARLQITGLHRLVVISLESASFDKKSIIKPEPRLTVYTKPSYNISQATNWIKLHAARQVFEAT